MGQIICCFFHQSLPAKMVRLLSLTALLFMLSPAATAQRGEKQFSTADGFSFRYPGGWKLTTESDPSFSWRLPPLWKVIGPQERARSSVIIFDTFGGPRWVTLTTVNGAIPLADIEQTKAEVGKRFEQNAADMKATLSDVEVYVEPLNNNQAAIGYCHLDIPDRKFRQVQACFPANGKTFIVTCTGLDDDHGVFRNMVESVSIDRGFFLNLPIWGRYTIIGAAVGAVCGAIPAFLRRSKKAKTE